METTTLLIVSGLAGFSCLLWGDYLLYKRYKQSKEKLINQINAAETELQKDIQELNKVELLKTKAGKELLNLLNQPAELTLRESPLKLDFHWLKTLNFSNSIIYLTIITVILGFMLGLNVKDAYWLNSDIAAAQAEQINVQTEMQQRILELEVLKRQAELEELIALQEQQLRLEQELQAQRALQAQQLSVQEKTLEITRISVLTMSISVLGLVFLFIYRNLRKPIVTPIISESGASKK